MSFLFPQPSLIGVVMIATILARLLMGFPSGLIFITESYMSLMSFIIISLFVVQVTPFIISYTCLVLPC